MTTQLTFKSWIVAPLLAVAICVMPSTSARPHHQSVFRKAGPSIRITLVPPKGGGPDRLETIAGRVRGANVKECKVILFALGGDTWYVQPYVASPYTNITVNHRWQNETHLGSQYAALLVRSAYRPPATTGTLPVVSGDVLAITVVPASEPVRARERERPARQRIIRFSGYEWRVKESAGRVGPGPNYFSAAADNVAIDERGRLHLRITKRDGRFFCPEVISRQSFGYGTYRFYVDSTIDKLDINAVLGLFTWSDEPDYHHRELDIEFSRWGKIDNENGQFVVQPYTIPQNIVRFETPAGLPASTHSFSWQPGRVFFQSFRGRRPDPDSPTDIIYQQTFTNHIPQPGVENARINLWLIDGRPPAGGKEVEVIISGFEFIPAP